MLILYPLHFLNSFTMSDRFCRENLGFSIKSIMSSANSGGFTSRFTIWVLLFICLVWLLQLGLPKLCYTEVARRHHCLLLNLGERPYFWMLGTCKFGISGLYYVEICSFYALFDESIYHEWMLNFVKCFFGVIEIMVRFIYFLLLMWCITLIDLWILNLPCVPEINPK